MGLRSGPPTEFIAEMPPPFVDLEVKRCFGHRSNTTAVAWNLNGDSLLAAGDASTILIYDTGRLAASSRPENNVLTQCYGHKNNIEVLVTSTTSPAMFVSAGIDSLINVFDTRSSPRPIHSITADSKCLFADWAPDGATVAVGLSSNTVCFIDCLTWSVRNTLNFDGEVNQFRWNTDATRIFFTRGDGTVDMYSWPNLEILASVRGHVQTCFGIATHPNAPMFAVASRDTCLSVWEEPSMTCNFVVDRWDRPIQQAEYSHDGSIIAVAGDYDRIDLIDSVTGSLLHTIPTIAMLNNMAFHPKRLLLAYAPAKPRDRYNAEMPLATYVWGFPRSK